jgi:uncharacterized protein YxjI
MSVTEQEITNWRDEIRFPSGFIADQVVSIDGKIWVMEYKLNDKNDFIKTALRFELWDYYGQAYLRPEKSSKIFDG